MPEESSNFTKNIHDENYKSSFNEPLITYQNMVYDNSREKESLNGCWNFQVDPYDTFLRSEWFKEEKADERGMSLPLDYDFNNWEEVYVPSCWNTSSDMYYYYEGVAVYTRTFKYYNHGEDRVFLKIGAANYESRLFLNREFIGCHRGGSTPFYVEVTDLLQKINRIQVVVDNTRKSTAVPTLNTDWFNYGGLYRDVELIRLPATYIKDFNLALQPDSNYNKIMVEVEVAGEELTGKARLEIPELELSVEIPVKDGTGQSTITASPELWSPDNPKLYQVLISYGRDTVEEKLGFREIKVAGRDIFLNGEKIFLKGISSHEESVLNGKAVIEEEIIENLKIAREMNCNYVRLAHYPHSGRVARLADKLGIMLWEEIPVYWAIDFDNPETYQDAENQLLEMINRDKNRASVIIWSVGNENEDTDSRLKFMSKLARQAREADSSRLVSAACLVDNVNNQIADRLVYYLDIIGINEYYGWYDPDFDKLAECMNKSDPDKPVVITEFGAGARAGARGTIDDLFTEDYQYNVYRKQIEVLDKISYIKGMSPWILFDFRCPRRTNRFQQGYNLKGLLSADKKHKKKAFYLMQDYYKEVGSQE